MSAERPRRAKSRSSREPATYLSAGSPETLAQLRWIGDIMPVMLTRCSRDMRYLFVNRAYAEFLRLPREQITGKPIREVLGETAYRTIQPGVKTVLAGRPVEYEAEIPYPAGARFMQVAYRPDRNGQGKVVGWLAAITDITARKRAEAAVRQAKDELAAANAQLKTRIRERTAELTHTNAALRAEMHARQQAELSNVQLAAIVEALPDAIVGLRTDGRIVSWNKGAERLYGHASAAIVGRSLSLIVPPDKRQEFRQVLARVRRGENVGEFETVRVRKDGRRIDASVTFSLIRDGEGRVIGVAHSSRDISRRKEAEAAVRDHEVRFREFVELAPDAVVIADQHGRIQLVNAQTERLFGYRREELVGQPLELLMPERHRRKHVRRRRDYLAQPRVRQMGTGLELSGRRKDGSEFPVEISLSPLPSEDGKLVCGTIRDVTERRQAAARLQEMLGRVSDLYHRAPCGYHSVDREGMLVEINDTALKWLGYDREELVGKKRIFDLQTPASRKQGEARFPQLLKRGAIRDLELEFLRKDGSVLPVLVNATAIRDATGRFLRSRTTFIDLTDRKRVEQALRESEARLQAILDYSPLMIFLKDTEGRYLLFNRRFARAFRLQLRRAVGRTDAELFPPQQAAAFRENDLEVIRSNRPLQFEEVAQHDDGPHTSIVAKFPLRGLSGKVYAVAGIVTDITERRRLEADLLQVVKREQLRIGQDLHDGLGQQLTAITCLCNVLKQNLTEQSSPETEIAARIATLLESANKQLRGLARGLHPVSPDPAGLMFALENLAADTGELSRTACIFTCPAPVMIEDNTVATHLFRIAQEAVSNALKHGRARRIEIRLSSAVEGTVLVVANDGANFRAKSRKRTGLGLRTMSYRADIIGGTVAIRAATAGGTEVVCTLPSAATRKPED